VTIDAILFRGELTDDPLSHAVRTDLRRRPGGNAA